ncbi:MAG: hypothetical protein ABIR38_05340 [Chthoniobacterales bacterium]
MNLSRMGASSSSEVGLTTSSGCRGRSVPGKVWEWLRGEDPARVRRVTAALWQMEKLDLAKLERAAV